MHARGIFISVIVAVVGFSAIAFVPRKVALVVSGSPQPLSAVPHREAEVEETLKVTSTISHLPPPAATKGIYLTGWTAGSASRMEAVMRMLKEKKLNTVVIDIKDYSGYLSYNTNVPLAEEIGAHRQLRMKSPEPLIAALHKEGIYVIGRITVFQDPILAKGRPQWALKDDRTGALWKDRKGLSWLDASSEGVWDYVAAIGEDAYARGFDELNFDYIRFPSDGALEHAVYPFYKETEPKHETVARFFAGIRKRLEGKIISADLFGMTTVSKDDQGIGQLIEDGYRYFDYLSPMVYPSHYANGWNGFKNPAEHPGEVIAQSMEGALLRRAEGGARIRPWLQAFDLGARYDAAKVRAQITATEQVFTGTSTDAYGGWLMWDPANKYKDL